MTGQIRLSKYDKEVLDCFKAGNIHCAKELYSYTKLYPQAIYRSLRNLKNQGYLTEFGSHPVKYRMNDLGAYLKNQENNFVDTVGMLSSALSFDNELSITHIEGREEIWESFRKDEIKATTSIKLLILGTSSIPPEKMLANKQAVDRGVKLKILVQEQNADRGKFSSWKQMSFEVRKTESLKCQFLLIDDNISYIVLFDKKDSNNRFAIRFTNSSLGKVFNNLFDQQWKHSGKIN
jgi:sugar-specific transcriptional regulator TrmB